MTPGTPINFRPLWGLLAVLATLCGVLFFACPLAAKHQVSREIRIRHFARLQQPPMMPVQPRQQQAPKPTQVATRMPILPTARTCTICGEPALRYLHAIQSPFPENRPIYEAPKVINVEPPTVAYSAPRPAAYAGAYDHLHP
jgi:hypothetical protein